MQRSCFVIYCTSIAFFVNACVTFLFFFLQFGGKKIKILLNPEGDESRKCSYLKNPVQRPDPTLTENIATLFSPQKQLLEVSLFCLRTFQPISEGRTVACLWAWVSPPWPPLWHHNWRFSKAWKQAKKKSKGLIFWFLRSLSCCQKMNDFEDHWLGSAWPTSGRRNADVPVSALTTIKRWCAPSGRPAWWHISNTPWCYWLTNDDTLSKTLTANVPGVDVLTYQHTQRRPVNCQACLYKGMKVYYIKNVFYEIFVCGRLVRFATNLKCF